ncbi:MAG: chorismate lyase [Deltaproteobacteria bacterium]|nr:chorismate lyase [Deltaproteobacteria bacterium]
MDYSIAPGWSWSADKEAMPLLDSLKLPPQQKLLLLSDGSLTKFLETSNRSPVDVEIKNHETRRLEKDEAEYLEVDAPQDAIIRDVWLIQNKRRLVYARSIFPLSGLDKHFIETIAAGIEPIGKSLTGHGLSASKDKLEICAVHCIDANNALNLAPEAILWAKRYRLSAQTPSGVEGIKASITEIFSPEIAGRPPLNLEK